MHKKKLFFIGWADKELGMIDVMIRLSATYRISYWSGDRAELDEFKAQFPDTIVHDHYAALHGIPASGVDTSRFSPPDLELLHALRDTESTVLTMMNKRFERLLVGERKHLYYTELGYWYGVLTELRPDAIIFPCAPHTVYDYCIYGLAKHLAIPTIFFELTAVGSRSLLMHDYQEGSPSLARGISSRVHVNRADLPPDIRRYYEWQMDSTARHTPHYLHDQFRVHSGWRGVSARIASVGKTIITHKDMSALWKVVSHIPRRYMQNMRTEYHSVAERGALVEPFIYVPLGYQPERTTCPQGGDYVDQLLMVETLAASLPSGWHLAVKEHPAQWLHRGPDYFSYRYRGYYRRMAALDKVSIVPITTDSYSLIVRAAAIATVTSTAGWEALLRSKPALVFGYPWYQHAPGVLRVTGAESGRMAVEKIISGFRPAPEDMIAYLLEFGAASFIGSCEPHGKEISGYTASENASAIAGVLATELKRLGL